MYLKTLSLISGFICSLSLISCAQQPAGGGDFVVSGKLTNASSKVVYLKQIDFSTGAPIILDSAALKPDGAFQLKTEKIKGQHLFIIQPGTENPFLFINDDAKVTMDLNQADPLNPVIKGSDATTGLYKFMHTYREDDSTLTATFLTLDSLNKMVKTTAKDDSIKAVLGKQRDAQIIHMNEGIKDYVNNTKTPVGAFYVLQFMAPRSIKPEDLLPLTQAASDRFKEDGSLAGYASQLKVQLASSNPSNYPLLNQKAPDLAMQTPAGQPMKISDFKGKYVLVDFWASWCGPCRAENPNVVQAYNKYKDKNFTILGVSLDKDKGAWEKAIKADHLSWNHMSDLKYWNSIAVNTYQFNGIPFNVLIDPSGKIIANNLRGEDLENKLAEVLK